ncbi:MAG: hypothetical protein A2Y77_18140 [Planctomycetes bacterium RBG_13_62_9]|nr:MAG: hypothetical protein A2Y77_18140 [Planctomycetes bacterium RBG_13_62_9]
MDEKQVLEMIAEAKEEGARVLDLSGKDLTSIPRTLAQLTNLQVLDLHSNQLTGGPGRIGPPDESAIAEPLR